jgi:hypothetical protein
MTKWPESGALCVCFKRPNCRHSRDIHPLTGRISMGRGGSHSNTGLIPTRAPRGPPCPPLKNLKTGTFTVSILTPTGSSTPADLLSHRPVY